MAVALPKRTQHGPTTVVWKVTHAELGLLRDGLEALRGTRMPEAVVQRLLNLDSDLACQQDAIQRTWGTYVEPAA